MARVSGLCAKLYEAHLRQISSVEAASFNQTRTHLASKKIMQDADAIVADCKDMIAAHGIDPAVAREIVAKAQF